jgi:tyrosine-protein kinase Etk/Wzc
MSTAEQLTAPSVQPTPSQEEGKIDLLDILLLLARRKRFIALSTIVGFVLGITASIVMKPTYTAMAVIMPPQQQSSASALLSSLGGLAALSGGGSAASALGLKSPGDLYVGILKSRTIADEIIGKFHLLALHKNKKMADARKDLEVHSTIESAKDGLIEISVTDHDPHLASDLANEYVSELYSMNAHLAVTEAAQRRVFFDEQLEGEKKALVTAEEDLRETQQRTGLIQLSGQAQMIISSIAQLRAQIASSEVQAQSLRTFATDENPDLNKVEQQISTMKGQLAKLENDQQKTVQPGNIAVPAGRVPEDSLEYERKYREVKFHETLFELLSRQYEAAKIDEAKSAPIIQVIDNAVPPDKKSGPHRMLITVGMTVLFFLLSFGIALISDLLAGMKRNPPQAAKLNQIYETLRKSK